MHLIFGKYNANKQEFTSIFHSELTNNYYVKSI